MSILTRRILFAFAIITLSLGLLAPNSAARAERPRLTHEISEAEIAVMSLADLEVVWYAHENPIPSGEVAAMRSGNSDPYEWKDWRVCPTWRWRMKYLLDWDRNSGPYSLPVLCGLAEEATSLTQGGSESNTDFLRRALRVLCGYSQYPED